jgi:hypothetical protein
MNTHAFTTDRHLAARYVLSTVAAIGITVAAASSVATYWQTTGLAESAQTDAATEACASKVSAMLDTVAESASWDYVPNLAYADIRSACAAPDIAYSTPGTFGYIMVYGAGYAITVQGYGECFYATQYGYASITDSFGTVILSNGITTEGESA